MSQTRRFRVLVAFSIAFAIAAFVGQLFLGDSLPFMCVYETTISIEGDVGLASDRWIEVHGGIEGGVLKKTTLSPLVAWKHPGTCIRLVVHSTETPAVQLTVHAPGGDVRGVLVRTSKFAATATQETEWIFDPLPSGWDENDLQLHITSQDGGTQDALIVALHRRQSSRWKWAIRT